MDNPTLRKLVRFFYDLQRVRIALDNRVIAKVPHAPVQLEPGDKTVLSKYAEQVHQVEADALKNIREMVREHVMWNWVKAIRGAKETIAGVLFSTFDIHRARTVSSFWAYAGLGMERPYEVKYQDGDKKHKLTVWSVSPQSAGGLVPRKKGKNVIKKSKDSKGNIIETEEFVPPPERKILEVIQLPGEPERQKRRKGQYPSYNLWLRTKMIGVLGPCLLKSKSSYNKFYYDMRTRLENEITARCPACEGTGFIKNENEKPKKCKNCKGTGGPVSWGHGKAHRHMAALRYMVKMFLKDFFLEWQRVLGIPSRGTYQEEYLKHHHEPAPTSQDQDLEDFEDELEPELEDLDEDLDQD